MFNYEIKDEWKKDIVIHKNDPYDFVLTIPEETPIEVYNILVELLKKGKFIYKLTRSNKISLITSSWYCTSYTDVVQYLCAHKRKNGILWDVVEREPEAVIIERVKMQEEDREHYAENTEETFAAGEGFHVDDDGNWHPV